MQARWPLAIAMLGILGTPVHLGAQGHASAGGSPGRFVTSHPGPRSPRPSIRRPYPTIGMIPPFRGGREHRPILLRSSLLGLVVFDPYWWLAPGVGDEEVAPSTPMQSPGPRLSGGLQLDVEPRRALVYVDGVLAGTVDQFKGYFLHLEADAGFHVIDFLAADYEPLTIGVTVVPNQTTTYRGFLNRASGR